MTDTDEQREIDALEVEITDLAPQTRDNLPVRLSALLVRWQGAKHLRARRWLSGILLTSLVLVLLVALLNPIAGVTALLAAHWPFQHAQSSPAANRSTAPRSALPGSSEIACPVQSAWSANSSYVAILGYTQPCTGDHYVPAQVDIYAATTAGQIARWQPDPAILAALKQPPPISLRLRDLLARRSQSSQPPQYGSIPALQYLQILWSPDNQRLAISFRAVTLAIVYDGLFLANRDGGRPEVLLRPELSQIAPGQSASLMLKWDLQTDSAVLLAAPPPALTYAWDARDQLVPAAPLNAQSTLFAYAAVPPGNPSGGRTFSIWQPGHPGVVLASTPRAYLWSTSFAAWSPDGRYLITNFSFTGLMEPPGQAFPALQALSELGVEGASHIPAHDPALISVASNARTVAWNPAGTLLVVSDRAGVLDLYDCHTGQLMLSFTPRFTQALSGSAILLSWSPDGRFLSLSSAQWGLISLWSTSSLLSE